MLEIRNIEKVLTKNPDGFDISFFFLTNVLTVSVEM